MCCNHNIYLNTKFYKNLLISKFLTAGGAIPRFANSLNKNFFKKYFFK